MGTQQTSWVTARPAPALSPFVERYVGYRLRGFPPGIHRGLPSRHMTFIVSIGPDIDVVHQTDPAQQPARYRCVLSGLAASSALISHTGDQEGVALELTPIGSRALFGMPAGAVWNTSLELADVVGPTGDALWERLQELTTWRARFRACDEVLSSLVGEAEVTPELARAWDVIVGTGGTATVAGLAGDVGWSRQHLARRFTREFGLGPKLAARVVRFERARNLLRDVPSFVNVAQVAAVCGYYDQAHLDRDFVELAGCPPTEWMREELPSFQDGGEPDPSC
jgi:AraC-like DNA-binding protein